jgi:hypothetical protein
MEGQIRTNTRLGQAGKAPQLRASALAHQIRVNNRPPPRICGWPAGVRSCLHAQRSFLGLISGSTVFKWATVYSSQC